MTRRSAFRRTRGSATAARSGSSRAASPRPSAAGHGVSSFTRRTSRRAARAASATRTSLAVTRASAIHHGSTATRPVCPPRRTRTSRAAHTSRSRTTGASCSCTCVMDHAVTASCSRQRQCGGCSGTASRRCMAAPHRTDSCGGMVSAGGSTAMHGASLRARGCTARSRGSTPSAATAHSSQSRRPHVSASRSGVQPARCWTRCSDASYRLAVAATSTVRATGR